MQKNSTKNYDSSKIAFNFYENIYNHELQPNNTIQIGKTDVPISGDIIFNFNPKKMQYYCSVIDSDNSASEIEKLYCKQVLKILSEYYNYNVLNISAYPKTGGLNNIKQNLGNDRLDVFISALFLYYQEMDSFILDSGSINMNFNNREILRTFLNGFTCEKAEESLYRIVKFLYQINDKKLINDLKDNGMKHLSSADSILQYCSLAIRFWKNRAENICTDDNRFYNEKLLKTDIGNKIDILNEKLKQINYKD